MSITFKRITPEVKKAVPNGFYPVEIQKMEKIESDYGKQLSVTNLIESPEEYKGQFLWKNFNIWSNIPEYKEKAEKQFNEFWSVMTDDQDGSLIDDIDFQKVVFKKALAKVWNFPKNGEMKSYIVSYKRLDKGNGLYICAPQKPVSFKDDLDDDLPF